MDYVFESAEDALKWAVEVLRRRRLPQTASFWREIEAEAEWVEQAWEGNKNMELPQGREERMELALRVMEGLEAMKDKHIDMVRLLQLWGLGDWADEGRLHAAMAIQEKCRREGMRVRMAYRYTYAQLGALLDCDRKVVWRRVQEALAELGRELGTRGIVAVVDVQKRIDNFKKDVYLPDFKSNS